jgi:hypothetical protein
VGPGPSPPTLISTESGSRIVRAGHKRYFFDLGSNNKGQYLRITEVSHCSQPDSAAYVLALYAAASTPLSGMLPSITWGRDARTHKRMDLHVSRPLSRHISRLDVQPAQYQTSPLKVPLNRHPIQVSCNY